MTATTTTNPLERIRTGTGFIAALDQSGGSTPKTLAAYGVPESSYTNDEEMFDQVHAMRSRVITNPAFNGERLIGAILFEDTIKREIEGQPTAHYLWKRKGIVPFLKIDRGLEDAKNGVRLMRPLRDLSKRIALALERGAFGTKMRSVIELANRDGIRAIVDQQFDWAEEIAAAKLVPIVEPEVSIDSPEKDEAESALRNEILRRLETLPDGQHVMLKLTLPDALNFYRPLIEHPKVDRVVALSGGYSRDEANDRLRQNIGMTASFSRALLQDLRLSQSEEVFTEVLDQSIQSIFEASVT